MEFRKQEHDRILFQTVNNGTVPDRTDHVWFEIVGGINDGRWKCCLCGGITNMPPAYPTRSNWVPLEYELPLTGEERLMCQNVN